MKILVEIEIQKPIIIRKDNTIRIEIYGEYHKQELLLCYLEFDKSEDIEEKTKMLKDILRDELKDVIFDYLKVTNLF